MRVAVLGAGGRMGSTVCEAVDGAPDMELVAAVDPAASGRRLLDVAMVGTGDLMVSGDITSVGESGADAAVDFSTAAACRANLNWCSENGVNAVVGTTGLDESDMARLEERFPSTGSLGCVVAPNFAIGAVLMMRFAELAAPWFESVEVVELHHDKKVDAPSGTALLTAERIAGASSEWASDPTQTVNLAGARGGRGPAGITIHSVRLRGLVAHQEVLFGTDGQVLTIRHDSMDRTSFMPGVLLGLRHVIANPGVTIGLDRVLGI